MADRRRRAARGDGEPGGRGRRAFTLLEILLVVSLMVVIAAFAWPALHGAFETETLRQAAEQVRVAWSKARVEAMNTGLVHVFRYLPETGEYAIAPWAGADAELELAAVSQFDLAAGPEYGGYGASAAADESPNSRLPDGVKFLTGQRFGDTRGLTVEIATEADILFYPDGTASDAVLTLGNEDESLISLELHGLTGLATVGEVVRVQGPGPEARR